MIKLADYLFRRHNYDTKSAHKIHWEHFHSRTTNHVIDKYYLTLWVSQHMYLVLFPSVLGDGADQLCCLVAV